MTRSSLRIAMLVRSFPTISETFIRDQIEDLREDGHRVDLYALRAGHTAGEPNGAAAAAARYLVGPELPRGPRRRRLAGRIIRGMRSPIRLARLTPAIFRDRYLAAEALHALPVLRAERPKCDVIHAHYGMTGRLALLLRDACALRGPLVTTFHDADLTTHAAPAMGSPYEELFRRGERFTVNSRFLEELARELGVPPERLRRLPVGVDAARIPFHVRRVELSEPLRVITVARLVEVKGIRFGLRAAALLMAGGQDVRYTVVGEGPLHAELRAEAANLGIEDRVRFTGALSQTAVLREYADHDLFLLPGIVTADGQTEAQGRVLLEAQAAGLPIVASRVGGIPETVAPEAGVLVAPRDANAIADAVRLLLADPDAWARMGEAGRRHVEQGYDPRRLRDRLVRIYEEAMADAAAARIAR